MKPKGWSLNKTSKFLTLILSLFGTSVSYAQNSCTQTLSVGHLAATDSKDLGAYTFATSNAGGAALSALANLRILSMKVGP